MWSTLGIFRWVKISINCFNYFVFTCFLIASTYLFIHLANDDSCTPKVCQEVRVLC